MKKEKLWLVVSILLILWGIPCERLWASPEETIYNSPYVDFSPDGKAWTTNAGDVDYAWYETGTTVRTGIPSTLREPEKGEHYYWVQRTGSVPVGKWVVQHRTGHCIHHDYPVSGTNWHGIEYGRKKCGNYYYSGWMGYCADCGEMLTDMYLYMSSQAAASIDYLDLGTGMSYYYLCPHCRNLEQGVALKSHTCLAVSWNQYKVRYDANCGGMHGGYMEPSIHMYNNADKYQGESVTPITHLTGNQYTRIGYEFLGWNTSPDGLGETYEDRAEIYNLTDTDCNNRDTWRQEEQGIVTLYAQWRPSRSTLQIDPAGGIYGESGEITFVARDYGEKYEMNSQSVKAPVGYQISFETNGGSAVEPLVGTQHFTEWAMVQPFVGRLQNDIYYYTAPDGNVDIVRAQYVLDPIVLPGTQKAGFSFGGWYYDKDFSRPAGATGDLVTPSSDLILYAQWIDLRLTSRDNYVADGGKGAVDLSWSQADGKGKVYIVYQSRDGENWTQVNEADDIGNSRSVTMDYSYTGRQEKYMVPYTGLYLLEAAGAQGEDYDSYEGGWGGTVSMQVWLEKGEILTITVGGRNGYENGGKASVYGNGGGCTKIASDRKGLLLVAGGGGGASTSGAGGAGGSRAGTVEDEGGKGQDGMTGGGGGYEGGIAGERIVHHHTAECYMNSGYSVLSDQADIGYTVYKNETSRFYWSDGFQHANRTAYLGDREHLIPVLDNSQLTLDIFMDSGANHYGGFMDDVYIAVYDQKGKCIFKKTYTELANICNREHSGMGPGNRRKPAFTVLYNREEETGSFNSSWTLWTKDGYQVSRDVFYGDGTSGIVREYYDAHYRLLRTEGSWADSVAAPYLPQIKWKGTWYWHRETVNFRHVIDLPQDATGLYIVAYSHTKEGRDGSLVYQNVLLSGGRWAACGYQEGQVISSMPAYGGSSYVNTACAFDYHMEPGVRTGDGIAFICSESIGYTERLEMEGVKATDLAAPDVIPEEVVMEPGEGAGVEVTWKKPRDNGTEYFHVVESYLPGSEEMLCRSNITSNTLVSGIAGYYFAVNVEENTEVSEENGQLIDGQTLTIDFEDNGRIQTKYLHVAPVDVAGNVGATKHICVENASGAVPWKLYTNQMEIEQGENVYSSGDHTWYVKSDGVTPFALYCRTYMDGVATRDYQPNYTIFESVVAEGVSGEDERTPDRNILYTPSHEIQEGDIFTEAGKIQYSLEGKPLLAIYPYARTTRSHGNRNLDALQKFTLPEALSGTRIHVMPIAGADWKDTVIFSDYAKDQRNGITLIADGEGPIISGMEILEEKELIDWGKESVILHVTAADLLSGLEELTLTVVNTDNDCRQTWKADKNGVIRVELTEDEPIFSGSFVVTARATDHVGNMTEVSHRVTEFALEAHVERILSPHEPVFKRGESGILSISVRGYAERVEVEFPEEMTKEYPELNHTYLYMDKPSYLQEESLQFMIPLDMPVGEQYSITVRAFKGEEKLEEYPAVGVIQVDGSILDELRTRLR